jgi:hypothetical protein
MVWEHVSIPPQLHGFFPVGNVHDLGALQKRIASRTHHRNRTRGAPSGSTTAWRRSAEASPPLLFLLRGNASSRLQEFLALRLEGSLRSNFKGPP